MNHDPMLNFVKTKLEENEGISSDALSRLLTAAETQRQHAPGPHRSALCPKHFPLGISLLAASLAVAACGWFVHTDTVNARRESNLANVIELLRTASGETASASGSLADNLLAWQDAPADAEQ